MARLIIDGYNVIRRDPALRQSELVDPQAARGELLRLLGSGVLARYEVVVVFDGPQPRAETRTGRARALFAGRESADAVIARMATARDVVVTDDRGLATATLRTGPRLWSVESLLSRVRPASRRNAGEPDDKPSAPDLTRWRLFPQCARCMYRDRDDWARLCEEDAFRGRAANFREHW